METKRVPVEVSTGDNLNYVFYPINDETLSFQVQASNDAHIALTFAPNVTIPITEIFIGSWSNTKSIIRHDRKKPDMVEVDTPKILNGGEFKCFWIRWSGGKIEVGRGGNNDPFMSWIDPQPYKVNYIGVSTGWGAIGNWILSDVQSYATLGELTTGDDLKYVFCPIARNFMEFHVRAKNDAHIALTTRPIVSDPITEIFIGGWSNQKSVIRRSHAVPDKVEVLTQDILDISVFKGFWIRWINGNISVGKEGEDQPFMSWTDPEPYNIKFFGVSTGWGATGEWIFKDIREETHLDPR